MARHYARPAIDPINGPNHPTSFSYDIMNRLLGITYPDGSTASFTYDMRERRITAGCPTFRDFRKVGTLVPDAAAGPRAPGVTSLRSPR